MEAKEYEVLRAAEEHHWWYVGLQDLVLQLVSREAERLKRPLEMLDAGCGTGRLCQLMQAFGTVTGCDIHPVALEATAARGVPRVLNCDLGSPELGSEQYDVVTSMDVLYHQKISDEGEALKNLYRTLKPGGLLLLQVAAFEWLRGEHDAQVHTRRRYQKKEVTGLLEGAGFKVELSTYRLAPFFVPALVWRGLGRLQGKHRDEKAHKSDTARECPTWLNRCLTAGLRAENSLVAKGVQLPAGMSVFAAGRKQGSRRG